MINPLPEVEKIRKYLRYDTKTGLLYWQNRTGNQTWRNGTQAGREYNGYRQVMFFGTAYYEHRVVFKLIHGRDPDGEVDHVRTEHGNTPDNIRDATSSQNKVNRRGFAKSGYKGVSVTRDGKFAAFITYNKVQTYLGTYGTAEDAHEAYAIMAYILHGEFANTGYVGRRK